MLSYEERKYNCFQQAPHFLAHVYIIWRKIENVQNKPSESVFCYSVFEFAYKNEIDVVIFKFNKHVFNVFFIKTKYYNIKNQV